MVHVCLWNLCNNTVHNPNLYTLGSNELRYCLFMKMIKMCEGDMDKVDTIVNSIRAKLNTGGQSAATPQGDLM